MIWLQLLYVYLKIGILGFGGGYAMLSLIQADVVDRYGWISLQEFTDIVAISQMTPGPIGINSATYMGIRRCIMRVFRDDEYPRVLPDDIRGMSALLSYWFS